MSGHDFSGQVYALAQRPIGYSMCLPARGLVLRAEWQTAHDVWINQTDASSELGQPGSIVIFETEEMADAAAREVGGMAVPVVISSAGQA